MNRRAAYKAALCLLSLVFILQGLYFGAAGEAAGMSIGASVATGGVAVKENYTLRLTAADATCPMPGGSMEFGTMTFAAPGQYVYQIAEVNDGQSGYTYDGSVYTVTYTVARQGGALTCTRAVTKDGKAVAQAQYVFTNKYSKTQTESSKKGTSSSNPTGTDILRRPSKKTTRVTGTKIWVDNDNISGTRPEDITVRLYANGQPVDARPTWKSKTGNSWSYVFDKLPETDDSGRTITYTVSEDAVPCYETDIDGTTITNTLEDREPKAHTEVSGKKTWLNEDGAEDARPGSITLHLLRDGKDVARKTVDASTDWQYAFTELPADDGYDHAYTYTLKEDPIPGYFPRYKDYDVYNTKLPPETDEDSFDGFVNLLESNLNLGALSEQELEDLMSLFGYRTPSAGLLPTGDEIPWWLIAFGSAGLLALVALLILERKRRA